MTSLNDNQIDEYCSVHLPYMRGIMFGHYLLTQKGPYKDDPRILNATFLGSLIAGRIILEFLGIGLNQSAMEIIRPNKKSDSVWINDLGGNLVDLIWLKKEIEKHKSICEYIKMAHKAAGHLTVHEERPWPAFHPMQKAIDELFRTHIITVPKAKSLNLFQEVIK